MKAESLSINAVKHMKTMSIEVKLVGMWRCRLGLLIMKFGSWVGGPKLEIVEEPDDATR